MGTPIYAEPQCSPVLGTGWKTQEPGLAVNELQDNSNALSVVLPNCFSPAEDRGEVGNKGGRQTGKSLGYWRQKPWAGYLSRVQVFLRVQLRIPGCVSQLPVTGAKEPELTTERGEGFILVPSSELPVIGSILFWLRKQDTLVESVWQRKSVYFMVAKWREESISQ